MAEFYYSYQKEIQGLVLERFLPPYFKGGVNNWLNSVSAPGDSVFDAFGSHPLFALDTASQGYTVFINSHNPILNLAIQIFASAPSQSDFNKALADFSTLKRGDEYLEQHLISLYQTQCPLCKTITPASAYLWQKHAPIPQKKILTCTNCHQSGEFDIDAFDVQILNRIGSAKLHHARALSSVIDPTHPQFDEIEQLLEIFPIRSLYTIINMANRINGGIKDEKNKKLLTALLINFCDFGNVLWDPESNRFRPKQINLPAEYKEFNPWLFIPDWIKAWKQYNQPIQVTTWPDLPDKEKGGVCLLPYRLKESVALMQTQPIKAVIGLIPRPSNAFWSLSAFWSGWLFGKSSVKNMAFAFTRKRYDWKWHANALAASFEWINQTVPGNVARILSIPELSPGFVSALFAAGHSAKWNPVEVVLNPHEKHMVCLWKIDKDSNDSSIPEQIAQFPSDAIIAQLSIINEPAPYLSLHSSACIEFVKTDIHTTSNRETSDFERIQKSIEQSLLNNPQFYRINQSSKDKKSGYWWLKSGRDFNQRVAFSEKLEAFTLDWYLREKTINQQQYLMQISKQFSGLFLPSLDYLLDCLQAYGLKADGENWHLAEMDVPAKREAISAAILGKLTRLGQLFQYEIASSPQKVIWQKDHVQYTFHVIKTGICSPYLPTPNTADLKHTFIIFPGSKSKLVHYRLENDPRYREASKYCYLIKFRHILRILNETSQLGISFFLQSLDEDKPDLQDIRQMSLFSV